MKANRFIFLVPLLSHPDFILGRLDQQPVRDQLSLCTFCTTGCLTCMFLCLLGRCMFLCLLVRCMYVVGQMHNVGFDLVVVSC